MEKPLGISRASAVVTCISVIFEDLETLSGLRPKLTFEHHTPGRDTTAISGQPRCGKGAQLQ